MKDMLRHKTQRNMKQASKNPFKPKVYTCPVENCRVQKDSAFKDRSPARRRIPTPLLFLLRASPSMSETDNTVTLSHVLLQTHHENFMKGFFKFPFKGCFVRGWDCQRLSLTETVPSMGLSSLMKQPACLSDVGQKHFWEVISTRGL